MDGTWGQGLRIVKSVCFALLSQTPNQTRVLLVLCGCVCVCVHEYECLRILCRSCTNDCAWQIMKIRLADPLRVSASFRIALCSQSWSRSRTGMEIMRHLPCLRQRFHCDVPSWKRASLARPGMLRGHQGRASSSYSWYIFDSHPIPDSLPVSILIYVAKQPSRWRKQVSSWPRSCLLYCWAHPFQRFLSEAPSSSPLVVLRRRHSVEDHLSGVG